jgi:hypothetical protein
MVRPEPQPRNHFTFTPASELFALQAEPPAVHLAGVESRFIELPTLARDSTIANCPIWESERHLLLASAGEFGCWSFIRPRCGAW